MKISIIKLDTNKYELTNTKGQKFILTHKEKLALNKGVKRGKR